MNVYPVHENSFKFKVYRKQSKNLEFNKSDSWQENFQRFNDSMTIKASVVRHNGTEYQQKLRW